MWLTDDDYTIGGINFAELDKYAGSYGTALVRVHGNGVTDPGWGRESFAEKYYAGKMNRFISKALEFQLRNLGPVALVMRSLRLVCLDVDGKNGGYQHLGKLGLLPPTLAEESRSGNGHHLFYSIDDDWDKDLGYAKLGDRIGIVQGVDVRGVGCVYHYAHQLWNSRSIVPLPAHLEEMMEKKAAEVRAAAERAKSLGQSQDEDEALILQYDLERALATPIPPGRRNNTLFAIGSQLMLLGVEKWEDKILDAAIAQGLGQAETDKLIANISAYGG